MEEKEILLLEQRFESFKKETEKEFAELKRITEDQEKRLRTMEMSKEKTDYQYEEIIKTLNKLNEVTIPNLTMQIEELKNKPVKRYEQVIAGIISVIVSGIVGFVVSKITNK